MKGHEKHILSPQSINFAPSVNLGRRTSHSPARSLFNDIWAIFLSCFGDFSDFSYFFHGLFRILGWVGELFVDFSGFSYFFMDFSGCFGVVWGAVLWISAVSATFFQNFSSFWAGLGSCFRSFMDYSYPRPARNRTRNRTRTKRRANFYIGDLLQK